MPRKHSRIRCPKCKSTNLEGDYSGRYQQFGEEIMCKSYPIKGWKSADEASKDLLSRSPFEENLGSGPSRGPSRPSSAPAASANTPFH